MLLISETNNFSLQLDCPRSKIPTSFFNLPFEEMVSKVLGKKRFVSITFIRESKMKALNKAHRGKDSSTDILSFSMGEENEILISINDARKKAREHNKKIEEYLPFLLIHGLLHLKGMAHGSKMESTEKKLSQLYILQNEKTQNNSRNRHRHLSNKSSGSRARRHK